MAEYDRLKDPNGVWNKLDYERDAIIEASAGTGKTFALESIVLKLICSKGYAVRDILLVTFTEKAAGELGDRIRSAISDRLAKAKAGELQLEDGEAEKLDKALRGFDEATICTIHSFCRQLLSEYAFENGVPMKSEIGGDDRPLAHRAVLEALKSSEFAKLCPDGLFSKMTEAKVKSIGKLVEEVEEKVLKTSPKQWQEKLDAAVAGAGPAVAEAHRALCALRHGNIGKYILDGVILYSSKTNPAFFEWLKEHFEELADLPSENVKGCPVPNKAEDVNYSIRSWQGTPVMNGKSGGKLFDSIPDCRGPIEALVAALKKMKSAQDQQDQKQLAIQLLELAIPRFKDLKKAGAVLSFDDMVSRAAEVVAGPSKTKAEADAKKRFFDSVRSHYRVALVDEFQDTDERQWNLFQTLFSAAENKVEDGKPGFLIVVGDPKQAIYSFRGADVSVYCKARDKITRDGGGACKKSLDETYRAKPRLVDAFNAFFGNGWFDGGAAGGGIGYDRKVDYPKRGNSKFGDNPPEDDPHERGEEPTPGFVEREKEPVLLLESMPGRIEPSHSGGFGKAGVCLPVFMRHAADEMKYLVGLDSAFEIYDKKKGWQKRRFRFGDMCVLVRTNHDAAVARRVLARNSISYGQYKQQGLFDSPEAEGVLALLDFLSSPSGSGNRAALLLSPLFNIHPSKLSASDKIAGLDDFIERLQNHARKKAWNVLFDTVMSDPCTALASPGDDINDFNRDRAAVRQIFDRLLAERGRLAQTTADLAAALRAWRKGDQSAGEDGALYGKESDADRVKIMTMHASKGLQFPVVFLAAGFSSPLRNETPDEDKPALLQEFRRLFYVALTRAEHRIYLPWSERAWDSGIGTNDSPLLASTDNGFLGKAIQSYFDGRWDTAFPKREASGSAEGDGTGETPHPTADVVTEPQKGFRRDPSAIADVDVPDGIKWRTRLRLQWDSFSSLPHGSEDSAPPPPKEKDKPAVDEKEHGGDDESTGDSSETEASADLKSKTERPLLPMGNISGSAFHEIMEELCNGNEAVAGAVGFTNACDPAMEAEDSPLRELIRRKMRKFSIKNRVRGEGADADSTENVLFRMVRHALDAEIDIGGFTFRLCDVPKRDRLAEVDFVGSEQTLLCGIPGWREGALNGAIDLLVRIGDRVFIIDWKTNSLKRFDDPLKRRGRRHVEAAMDEAGYHLQYRLYALAADAWLKGCGLTIVGAAYLFVRACEEGVADDVFTEKFDDIERIREEVSGLKYFGKEREN